MENGHSRRASQADLISLVSRNRRVTEHASSPLPLLASGEIFCLAGPETDGENPDRVRLTAGLWGEDSSALYRRGTEGWTDGEEGRRRKSISQPSVSHLGYELAQKSPFRSFTRRDGPQHSNHRNTQEDHIERESDTTDNFRRTMNPIIGTQRRRSSSQFCRKRRASIYDSEKAARVRVSVWLHLQTHPYILLRGIYSCVSFFSFLDRAPQRASHLSVSQLSVRGKLDYDET